MKRYYFFLAVIISAFLISAKAEAASGYKIVNKFSLPGDSFWDYLHSDDNTGTLYVSHGNIVQVINETNGKLIGTITGLDGVHGIALDEANNKGYITSGRDSMVVVFDIKTLNVIKKIKVDGKNPDAILFDPYSKKIIVNNGRSNNTNVIDPATGKIIANIKYDGNPEFLVSDGKGKVYVNIESSSKIAVINTSTFKIENIWSIAPGEEPSGLAIDNETHRLFSVCHNKIMMIVDAESGKIITSLPTGSGTDGAAFDTTLKCAYSSNGEGTLTVVKEENKDSFKVLENFHTQRGARTITVNQKTHHIYMSTANFEKNTTGRRHKMAPGSFVVLDIAAVK